MNKKKFISTGKDVINLEIKALQILKKNLSKSFNQAVFEIANCQSSYTMWCWEKWIDCSKNANLASVGTPSFNLSASEASHGDLGMVSKIF